jgi:hypothetical protein
VCQGTRWISEWTSDPTQSHECVRQRYDLSAVAWPGMPIVATTAKGGIPEDCGWSHLSGRVQPFGDRRRDAESDGCP